MDRTKNGGIEGAIQTTNWASGPREWGVAFKDRAVPRYILGASTVEDLEAGEGGLGGQRVSFR
jgi:hypothetical protein